MIEGWLKKAKEKKRFAMFGKLNKRWFKLDVINASFSYASGKSKNASKCIPMRDIEHVICEDAEKEMKEWQYFF